MTGHTLFSFPPHIVFTFLLIGTVFRESFSTLIIHFFLFPELLFHISADHKIIACAYHGMICDSFEQRRELPLAVYHNIIQFYRRFLAFITAQYINPLLKIQNKNVSFHTILFCIFPTFLFQILHSCFSHVCESTVLLCIVHSALSYFIGKW